jgi:hypothetical protein
LILDAPLTVRIGLEKNHDFFLRDPGAGQPVQKLSISHLPSQLLNPRQQFFTIAAYL